MEINKIYVNGQSYDIRDSRVSVMGASGSNHASGLVPDPGSTAGTSKYLREDGTWAEPEGNVGGETIEFTPEVTGISGIDLMSQIGNPEDSNPYLLYDMTAEKFYQWNGSSWEEFTSLTWDSFIVHQTDNNWAAFYIETGEQPTQLNDWQDGYYCYWDTTQSGNLYLMSEGAVTNIAEIDGSDINETTYTINEILQIKNKTQWLPDTLGNDGDVLKTDGSTAYWGGISFNDEKSIDIINDNVSGSIQIDPNYDVQILSLSGDVSSLTVGGSVTQGKILTSIIYNGGSSDKYVTIAHNSTYICQDGQNLSLTVPAGGYCEVSYLYDGSRYFVRGV